MCFRNKPALQSSAAESFVRQNQNPAPVSSVRKGRGCLCLRANPITLHTLRVSRLYYVSVVFSFFFFLRKYFVLVRGIIPLGSPNNRYRSFLCPRFFFYGCRESRVSTYKPRRRIHYLSLWNDFLFIDLIIRQFQESRQIQSVQNCF